MCKECVIFPSSLGLLWYCVKNNNDQPRERVVSWKMHYGSTLTATTYPVFVMAHKVITVMCWIVCNECAFAMLRWEPILWELCCTRRHLSRVLVWDTASLFAYSDVMSHFFHHLLQSIFRTVVIFCVLFSVFFFVVFFALRTLKCVRNVHTL